MISLYETQKELGYYHVHINVKPKGVPYRISGDFDCVTFEHPENSDADFVKLYSDIILSLEIVRM